MDYRFAALLGAPYRGGNLLIHGNELLTPVGNRVTQVGSTVLLPPTARCRCRCPALCRSRANQARCPLQINMTESCSSTLPFENGRQIRTIAVSPDGRLLLSIDDEGRALVVNRRRRALLHHFSFKGPVRAAKWSPDGRYLAAAVGRLLQVRGAGLRLDGSLTPTLLPPCCVCGCWHAMAQLAAATTGAAVQHGRRCGSPLGWRRVWRQWSCTAPLASATLTSPQWTGAQTRSGW